MKLCIVCSSGGHLLKTYYLKKWWYSKNRIWITKKDIFSQSLLKKERVFFGYFPEQRNLFNFFRNLFLASKILYTEKPDVVFSTGAGIAVPFFFVAKLLRIQTVFIETFIFIPKATLSGKILYHIADIFIVQHPKLLKRYPRALYFGPIL